MYQDRGRLLFSRMDTKSIRSEAERALSETVIAEYSAAGFSRTSFAKHIGITMQSLMRYELGERPWPFPAVQAAAKGLGMRTSELLELAEAREERNARPS